MIKLLIVLLALLSGHEQVSKSANTVQIQSFNVVDVSNESEKEIEKDVNVRPEIEGVPLDNDLLDYIWDKSLENDLSYTLILAIAKTESNFQFDTESHTNDSGMMQLHRPTAKWIAEEMGLESYDLKNPYTSIDFAVFYLNSVRDAWDGKGLSEEDLFDMVVISYNRGVAGANKYVRKYGVENNTYLKKVLSNKEKLEMSIVEHN